MSDVDFQPIAEESVPPDAAPSTLHPKIVTVWRIGAVAAAALFSGVLVAAAMIARVSALWALGPALLAFALAIHLPAASWRAWSYRVGEADVRIRHGVLWRTSTVVLHARIQNLDTRQGPVARAFGLAKVIIYTAGTVGAVVTIPGLLAADAEALRDRLADLSGTEDAL